MSVRMMTLVYAAHFHDIIFIRTGKKKVTGNLYEKQIRVLNSNLKSVCLALADHANDEGEGTYPAVDTLCNKTELSEVTVVSCLQGMKLDGIISYTGRSKWNTCSYTINKEKVTEMTTWERQKRDKPGTKAALVSELKPLQLPTKATLVKPSIHPKPSINDEESIAIESRTQTLKTLYEQNVGPITPLAMQFLRNAAIDYPDATWYEPAFSVMVGNADHRSWNYVDTVLQNWKEHYFGWKPEFTDKKKGVGHDKKRKNPNPAAGKQGNLSPEGQQTADEINRRRAAKKAALHAVQ